MGSIGVDLDELYLIKTKDLEWALSIGTNFLRSGDRLMFAMDSATGLRSSEDVYATEWNYCIREWMYDLSKALGLHSCVVMTNQVRAKKSVDPKKSFAGGTDSTARRIAGMFDTRLELTRSNVSEHRYNMNVNIVANWLAMPATFVEFLVKKGKGVDEWIDLVKVAVKVGVIEKRGSWYYHVGDSFALGRPGGKLGQGVEEAAHALRCLRGVVVKEEVLRAVRGEGT
jgi:recombination protein RecA